MITFEFDEAESQAKLQKYGINFIAVQNLWNDPRLLEIPAKTEDEPRYLNVDFPTWMIESLDREAGKLGVTRQSIIKVWLAERLEKATPTHPSGGSR